MNEERFQKQNVKKEMDCSEDIECENDQCLLQTQIIINKKLTPESKKLGVYFDFEEDEYICGYCKKERENLK